MPGVLYDANNVVVGQAALYLTPWVSGAVEPPIPDSTPLFDVTVWETAGWSVAGATNEGFKANVETSLTQITIEEQSTPVGETIESKVIGFEAELAEDTLETIQKSWGGSDITVVAPASGVPGTKKMTLSDDIKYWTAALEMRNFVGLARRIYIAKSSMSGSGETSFRRAADKRLYPIRVASICKPTEIEIVDVTAVALP